MIVFPQEGKGTLLSRDPLRHASNTDSSPRSQKVWSSGLQWSQSLYFLEIAKRILMCSERRQPVLWMKAAT